LKRMVVLDANALLMPFQFKINLDLELERLLGPSRIVVPECVRAEVRGLASGGDRDAKMALKLLERYETVATEYEGDEGIVELVEKNPGCAVVTNDKALRERLTPRGTRCIMLFKRSRLGWDGEE
jgi:rRNA-processing protein FCF1